MKERQTERERETDRERERQTEKEAVKSDSNTPCIFFF